MIIYKTKTIKNGLVIIGGDCQKTFRDIKKISMSKKNAEKVFKVNLKGRTYNITESLGEVEISFSEPDNCFGWLERISEKEFLKRCA